MTDTYRACKGCPYATKDKHGLVRCTNSDSDKYNQYFDPEEPHWCDITWTEDGEGNSFWTENAENL